MGHDDRKLETEIAECVTRSHPEVMLDEMRERPDADLLHSGGFHVGLEILRTVDQRERESMKIMKAVSLSLISTSTLLAYAVASASSSAWRKSVAPTVDEPGRNRCPSASKRFCAPIPRMQARSS
jgi:hypothetical protein